MINGLTKVAYDSRTDRHHNSDRSKVATGFEERRDNEERPMSSRVTEAP